MTLVWQRGCPVWHDLGRARAADSWIRRRSPPLATTTTSRLWSRRLRGFCADLARRVAQGGRKTRSRCRRAAEAASLRGEARSRPARGGRVRLLPPRTRRGVAAARDSAVPAARGGFDEPDGGAQKGVIRGLRRRTSPIEARCRCGRPAPGSTRTRRGCGARLLEARRARACEPRAAAARAALSRRRRAGRRRRGARRARGPAPTCGLPLGGHELACCRRSRVAAHLAVRRFASHANIATRAPRPRRPRACSRSRPREVCARVGAYSSTSSALSRSSRARAIEMAAAREEGGAALAGLTVAHALTWRLDADCRLEQRDRLAARAHRCHRLEARLRARERGAPSVSLHQATQPRRSCSSRRRRARGARSVRLAAVPRRRVRSPPRYFVAMLCPASTSSACGHSRTASALTSPAMLRRASSEFAAHRAVAPASPRGLGLGRPVAEEPRGRRLTAPREHRDHRAGMRPPSVSGGVAALSARERPRPPCGAAPRARSVHALSRARARRQPGAVAEVEPA